MKFNKPKRKLKSWVIVLLGIVFVSSALYVYVMSALQPVNAQSTEKQKVTIEPGTSTAEIGDLLKKSGIVKNGTVFEYYVKTVYKTGLKPGTYLLSPAMSVKDIADHITGGTMYQVPLNKVVIPEGSQIVEIADIIAKEFTMNKEDVVNQLNDSALLNRLQSKYPQLITDKLNDSAIKYKLEGYLYPATYSYFKKPKSIDEIIAPMLDKTDSYVVKHEDQIKQKQLDVHQFLTMASLIEEEATATTDRQKIVSVFYNRLKTNMPLQTDPTVLYALGKHKERVLLQDLKVASPYNTYMNKGLPVGPISNAGEPSLQAVLEPAQTDYYYFLAAPNGEVFFAKTLEEHNALRAKYITAK